MSFIEIKYAPTHKKGKISNFAIVTSLMFQNSHTRDLEKKSVEKLNNVNSYCICVLCLSIRLLSKLQWSSKRYKNNFFQSHFFSKPLMIHRAGREGRGPSTFCTSTSTSSQTLRHFFAVIHMRYLSRISNHSPYN